jgi:signal transduction histidine kinase
MSSHPAENTAPSSGSSLRVPAAYFQNNYWLPVATVLLTGWACLIPFLWIHPLLVKAHHDQQALWFGALAVFHALWNSLGTIPVLMKLDHEPTQREFEIKDWQKAVFIAVQIVVALLCTRLAGRYNPDGMKHWFWMPISSFAVLLLDRPVSTVTVLVTALVLATAQDYRLGGPAWAQNWFSTHFTISLFIVSCVSTAKLASRQRLHLARLATELKEANDQLKEKSENAAALAISQERNRMAREIHDSVGHSLTVVGAQLDAATALMPSAPDRALDAIQKARHASQEGLIEIRRSVSALRASPLENQAITEALPALIATMQRQDLKISLQVSGTPRPLPPVVELTLYRCTQECLTNACKHAMATEVRLHLEFLSNTQVSLTVTDNGQGMITEFTEGHGLQGLRERAKLLRGEFTVGPGPQGGTRCHMMIPA